MKVQSVPNFPMKGLPDWKALDRVSPVFLRPAPMAAAAKLRLPDPSVSPFPGNHPVSKQIHSPLNHRNSSYSPCSKNGIAVAICSWSMVPLITKIPRSRPLPLWFFVPAFYAILWHILIQSSLFLLTFSMDDSAKYNSLLLFLPFFFPPLEIIMSNMKYLSHK